MTYVNSNVQLNDRTRAETDTATNEQHDSGTMLAVALEMASYGWRVFPVLPPTPTGTCPCSNPTCTTPGKHPAIMKWQERATTNEAQIREWWEAWPNYNVGIATGTDSDLLALDADGISGLTAVLERGVPPGPTVQTGREGGGTHYYYTCPDNFDARNFAGKVPGLDARANGGYVIAPGSRHASGGTYQWITKPNGPLPEPPQWLVDLLRQKRTMQGPVGAKIPKGLRDDTLFSLARAMSWRGAPETAILDALRITNAEKCDVPLPDADLERIAASASSYDAADPLLTLPITDLGNAARFVHVNTGRALWSDELGTWFTWDGKRWAKQGRHIDRLAKETARAFQMRASQMPVNDPRRDEMMEATRSLQFSTRLKAMVEWARSDLEIELDQLDQSPWLLNCANGTLDLRAGELRPHSPDDMLTQMIDIAYDPMAVCPLWDQFLTTAMESQPAVYGYLQRLVGIFLTGDVSEKMLPIIWGEADTGKSVFTNTIRRLLGEYAQVMSEATLAHQYRKASGSAATPDLVRLRGARLAIASETAADMQLNEARIKGMTGRTPITARANYGNQIDFEPTHKLLIETNNRPGIPSGDEAVWRRVQLIPFVRVVPREDQDPFIEDKFAEEFPGILAWAIRGCLDWQQNGLQVPKEVSIATAEYQQSEDPIQEFIEDKCELGSNEVVKKAWLWDVYNSWCNNHSTRPLSKQKFNRALEARGITGFRDTQEGNTWSWKGISCPQPAEGASFGGFLS